MFGRKPNSSASANTEPTGPRATVDRLIDATWDGPGAVLPVLQAIQREFRYLPADAIRRVSERTGTPLDQLTGVATFYNQFRLTPMGRHRLQVCHGTACHVKGAPRVQEALRKHLQIAEEHDTDPQQLFTVERVFCVGCCSLAPLVVTDDVTYGHVERHKVGDVIRDFLHLERTERVPVKPANRTVPGELRICVDSCCVARGAGQVQAAIVEALAATGVRVPVTPASCPLMCEQTPQLEVVLPGQAPVTYARLKPGDVLPIIQRHFPATVRGRWRGWLDRLATGEVWEPVPRYPRDVREPAVANFYGRQQHIATEHFGAFDPLDLEAYRRHGGFQALTLLPDEIIAEIKASRLRGRGGAGFPVGVKREKVRAATGDVRYVICNGDEGDPGAYMDRMLLESFPYRVIEGMTFAVRAVGAQSATLYIRAEYRSAVQRIRAAIARCEAAGLLPVKFRVFEGAGAFICGEETALLESMEGKRGVPRDKPPYPAEVGWWGRPTLINNVETFACLPWIFRHGGAEFAKIGTPSSTGTKVFALAGKVNFPGLIEVPMGITLRQIIEEIGGGIINGGQLKAVQIGGPSGGCLPAKMVDTPVDYESLTHAGAIMGSGGLIILDQNDCMVDVARYFMQFMAAESCGKCTFCRIGTLRMQEILDKICAGQGQPRDLDELTTLAETTVAGSLCGLGRTAPNPLLTTLRHFRSEYEAHLRGDCPAGKCAKLIRYAVKDNCTGCTICAQHCPADAIPVTPYQRHVIHDQLCTRCDTCRVVCPHDAIEVLPHAQAHH
jgi:NADH-quinone oxidoreductase subunit F